MPITEAMQRIILRTATRSRSPTRRSRKACRTCASRACSRSSRADLARGSPRLSPTSDGAEHTKHGKQTMATGANEPRVKRQANFVFVGRQRQDRQDGQGRDRAPAARPSWSAPLRRQGIMVTKIKKQTHGARRQDHATRTSRSSPASSSTMMKAGVPLLQSFDIVGRGHAQPAVAQAAQRHQDRRRDRHLPDAGLPQVPALLRQPVLQPGGRRRAGRYPGRRCSTAWRPTRKRSTRIKGKIK